MFCTNILAIKYVLTKQFRSVQHWWVFICINFFCNNNHLSTKYKHNTWVRIYETSHTAFLLYKMQILCCTNAHKNNDLRSLSRISEKVCVVGQSELTIWCFLFVMTGWYTVLKKYSWWKFHWLEIKVAPPTVHVMLWLTFLECKD